VIVNVQLVGDKELVARLVEMPMGVRDALIKKSTLLALKLEALVKTGKLNGQVLNRITGALARSITQEVTATDNSVTGRVYSSGDVKYAAIHEYGGVINHPGGTAYLPGAGEGGKAAFVSNLWASSYPVELPRTKPHQIPMPERSFLRSSLSDMASEISLGLKAAVVEGIVGSMES
jgi:phage gpG-like protein